VVEAWLGRQPATELLTTSVTLADTGIEVIDPWQPPS